MFFIETADENTDKIQIDHSWTYGCNRCVICNNPFKHSRTWWGKADGVFELREKIAHYSCTRIMNDIKKKKQELLDLEYKLFERKYMIKDENEIV